MLSSATQTIDFLHIIDTLVAQYLKFDGSLQVRPILCTKANGHETHIDLTPKLNFETAIGSSKELHIIRIDFLVPEDLDQSSCEHSVRGFIEEGAEVVDVYLSQGTHFIMNAPVSLVNRLELLAPNNIVSIDAHFRGQISVHK